MDTDAAAVLADLERLALAGLRHETERLEAALRKEQKEEWDDGPRSGISRASAVRMSCLDALELWERAHDARVQLEEEAAVHARSRAPKAEQGSA